MTAGRSSFVKNAELRHVSSGGLVDFPPVVSYDSQYILIGSSSGPIFLFASKTGACLGNLTSHDRLVGFDVLKNVLEHRVVGVYVARKCADGLDNQESCVVRIWDYTRGKIVDERLIALPTAPGNVRLGFVFPGQPQPQVFAGVVSVSARSGMSTTKCCLWKLMDIEGCNELIPAYDAMCEVMKVTADARAVAASVACGFIAGVTQDTLTVVRVPARSRDSVTKLPSRGIAFTAVATHPFQEIVVLSDALGRIVVINDVFKSQVRSIYHWHHLPLYCSRFSSSGAYINSGGAERVLVRHAIEDKKRDYLSWLDAPIVQLAFSPDDTFCITAHDDNSIRLISANNNVQAMIRGFAINVKKAKKDDDSSCKESSYPVGLVVDPRSNCLVTNGVVGHAQFLRVDPFRVMDRVDIVQQNTVEELEVQVAVTDVESIRFSDSGNLMVTAERLRDGIHATELRLKLWSWSNSESKYCLDVVLEMQDAEKLLGMEFQPEAFSQNGMLAVLTDDKRLRIFIEEKMTITNAEESWRCLEMERFSCQEPTCMAFSFDGSVLAVGFEDMVKLWNPYPLLSRCKIQWPATFLGEKDPIREVKFGRFGSQHLLLAASSTVVLCWSLLDMRPVWCIRMPVLKLISDPASQFFAVITRNNTLHLFQPEKPCDKRTYRFELPASFDGELSQVLAAAFFPKNCRVNYDCQGMRHMPPSRIILLSSSAELYTADLTKNREDGVEEERLKMVNLVQEMELMTPFAKFVAPLRSVNEEGTNEEESEEMQGGNGSSSDGSFGGKNVRDFLNKFLLLSSQSLPGMSLIFDGFVTSVLSDAHARQKKENDENERKRRKKKKMKDEEDVVVSLPLDKYEQPVEMETDAALSVDLMRGEVVDSQIPSGDAPDDDEEEEDASLFDADSKIKLNFSFWSQFQDDDAALLQASDEK
ncbi:unnamed protein product [Notodromas monacha]|uniref:WD repeat-containing protein 75 second beta-propeller domain-containing protein n=1 Tax=Notodromas monacha TaxID=399045 RepID=A0A7R9BU89_9CRUS|nr:unnamed protein product [Notodromas monacha]CAG0920235.1 unnamed protein product [Notodromas monacha]